MIAGGKIAASSSAEASAFLKRATSARSRPSTGPEQARNQRFETDELHPQGGVFFAERRRHVGHDDEIRALGMRPAKGGKAGRIEIRASRFALDRNRRPPGAGGDEIHLVAALVAPATERAHRRPRAAPVPHP